MPVKQIKKTPSKLYINSLELYNIRYINSTEEVHNKQDSNFWFYAKVKTSIPDLPEFVTKNQPKCFVSMVTRGIKWRLVSDNYFGGSDRVHIERIKQKSAESYMLSNLCLMSDSRLIIHTSWVKLVRNPDQERNLRHATKEEITC